MLLADVGSGGGLKRGLKDREQLHQPARKMHVGLNPKLEGSLNPPLL